MAAETGVAVVPAVPETKSERYLRQIRNVVVWAFAIWIASIVIGGIVLAAVSAHAHAVQVNNACDASGGVMVSGSCYTG